jgi:YebC/PmpR family DNA-binding regulatory protein
VEGAQFEEISYEGYGPGGVAIMVDVLTDNRNRTGGEVRKLFEKGGGNMGSAGCVAFLFERKGLFAVDAKSTDEDTLLGLALDAGADDVKRQDGVYEVTCEPAAFNAVKEALEKAGLKPSTAELTKLPKNQQGVDSETGQKIVRLIEALDDHDDVQNVYSNADITEEMVMGA